SVDAALKDIDALLYVVNAEKGIDRFDEQFLAAHLGRNVPVIVAVNKIDKATRESLFEQLQRLSQFSEIMSIIPISAKKGDGVDEVLKQLVDFMPEGEPAFPEDIYTDKSMRFMAAESIREKALKLLEKEIPYGIGVTVNKFEMREDGLLYSISADIVCEKDTHKPIIIGKQGAMLKKIATEARLDIEEMVGCKVFLELWVRVKEDWRDNDYLLNELGYNKKDI
ncbi:MAG: GTPase Era, partial [Clostridia bacterium]